jgi:hypothetical protein
MHFDIIGFFDRTRAPPPRCRSRPLHFHLARIKRVSSARRSSVHRDVQTSRHPNAVHCSLLVVPACSPTLRFLRLLLRAPRRPLLNRAILLLVLAGKSDGSLVLLRLCLRDCRGRSLDRGLLDLQRESASAKEGAGCRIKFRAKHWRW